MTESEAVFEKYKERAAAKAKGGWRVCPRTLTRSAQADLIESLSALNEKQASKVAELEKALAASQVAAERAAERAAQALAPPVLDAKLDSKGVKELRDEVFKLRNTIKSKDEQSEWAEVCLQFFSLTPPVNTLQRDYDAEVKHSRSLQSQRAGSANPPAPAPNSEEAEKDQLSVRLYEDISGLAILNINVKQTNAGKEVVCNCLQTSIEGRSKCDVEGRCQSLTRGSRLRVQAPHIQRVRQANEEVGQDGRDDARGTEEREGQGVRRAPWAVRVRLHHPCRPARERMGAAACSDE